MWNEPISDFKKWILWCDWSDKCKLPKMADMIENTGTTKQAF